MTSGKEFSKDLLSNEWKLYSVFDTFQTVLLRLLWLLLCHAIVYESKEENPTKLLEVSILCRDFFNFIIGGSKMELNIRMYYGIVYFLQSAFCLFCITSRQCPQTSMSIVCAEKQKL